MSAQSNKIVIAHRGASGYLPEHTMEAKAMAYNMGVDYIEQDLVMSKDNALIVIHDIYLDDVTNVAKVYPEKSRADGRFYVVDFTLAELKQLNVYERFDPKTGQAEFSKRFPTGKGEFKLHTFEQEIELIQGLNQITGKNIGIYPEIKAPKFHEKEGKDIISKVLSTLKQYGYSTKSDACVLQCFDFKALEKIRVEHKSDLFLTQLLGLKVDQNTLKKIATNADAIGPSITLVLKINKENKSIRPTSLVKDAHQLNLKVHAYTLRADQFRPFDSFDDLMHHLFNTANVDGAFSDFPDLTVNFLKK